MDFVRSEIKKYEADERPVSIIVQVSNVHEPHIKEALSKELENCMTRIKSGEVGNMQFYTNDGIVFISRDGHSDRFKGSALNVFFKQFNRVYGTELQFFPSSPLNYFEY